MSPESSQLACKLLPDTNWNYALHLPVEYAGFNYSVGLISKHSTQRTDSLAVIGDMEVVKDIQSKLEKWAVKPAIQLVDMGYVNGEIYSIAS